MSYTQLKISDILSKLGVENDTSTFNRLFNNSSKPSTKPWSCYTCTFNNNSRSNHCEICNAPNPVCLYNDPEHTERDPNNLQQKLKTKVLLDGKSWNCSFCTFLNNESVKVCDICGNEKTNPNEV